MAQIKSKQIKLAAEGDFIIGDSSANGSILSIGAANQVVLSNGTTGAWGYLGDLRDPTGTVVIDTGTTPSQVNNIVVTGGAIGTGPTFTATGSDTNIDINLTIKGSGEVLVPISYAVVSDNALTTKVYVDSVATGLDLKNSVRAATIASSDLSGFTYTAASDDETPGAAPWTSVTAPVFDGVTLADGDRVLIKDATDARGNGIFTYDSGASTFVRAGDADNSPLNEVSGGMFTFVEEGATQEDTGWVASSPDGLATLGTTDIVMTQFSSAGAPTPNFGIVTGDSGTATADITTDTLNIAGGEAITTLATDGPETLTVDLDITGLVVVTPAPAGGDEIVIYDISTGTHKKVTITELIDSNVDVFRTVAGDTGTAVADTSTDTLTIIGGEVITTTAADGPETLTVDLDINGLVVATPAVVGSDELVIYDVSAGGHRKINVSDISGSTVEAFRIITGDTGSATADVTTDTLNIAGGEGIVTVATDDPEVLTVDLDIVGLITITPALAPGDSIVIYDASTATHVKVTVNQFFDDLDVGVVKYDDASATGGANEAFVAFFSSTPLADAAVTVFFNGLALRDTGWTRSGTTLTLVDATNGYSTESGDIISARYEVAP